MEGVVKFLAIIIILLVFPVKANVDLGTTVSFYKLLNDPKEYNKQKIFISGVVAAIEYHSGGGPLLRKVYLFPNSDSAAHFVLHEAIEIKYVENELFEYVKNNLNMHMIEVVGNYTVENTDRNLGSISDFIKLSIMDKNRFNQEHVGNKARPERHQKLR